MARLSDPEIARYHRDGWLVPRWRLPADRVDDMRDALDRLIADNPGVRPEKLVSAHIEGDNGEGVRGSRRFLALAMEPEIVELVSGVIGDDVILWGCHVFCKPAAEPLPPGRSVDDGAPTPGAEALLRDRGRSGGGYETPWHQDGHYWPIRPLANCTVWVALEPSTAANGCLRVIPGSHRARVLHPHLHEDRDDLTLNQRMADGCFDEADAADVELQPGQMSLHDVYMIHGAKANTSAQRRTGVALRYMPATSHFDRSLEPARGKTGVPVDFARRPLWLVRGIDRCGRNDLRIGHR